MNTISFNKEDGREFKIAPFSAAQQRTEIYVRIEWKDKLGKEIGTYPLSLEEANILQSYLRNTLTSLGEKLL